MTKKLFQRMAVIALVIVIVAGSFMFYRRNTETVYNVPRMMGMENDEERLITLDGPASQKISGPIVEDHGLPVSLDMDLRDLPQVGPEEKSPMREMGKFPAPAQEGSFEDPVLQSDQADSMLTPAPAPLITFKGLDFSSWGAGWPPDTHGDVGPSHYIQVVNTSIGIFNKTTGARITAFTFNSFFSANGGSGVCATKNNGDPVALYDQVSKRWIITDFAWSNTLSGPYYECIAVSKTTNPVSGGWWLYTLNAHSSWLNDYPKLGIWRDGIYMSANMFDCLTSTCSSASYKGARVWALNRSDLISGASLRTVAFDIGSAYYSLLPANVKGTLPPSGTKEYFLSDGSTSTKMYLWKFHANWTTPSSSTFTGPQSFTIAAYSAPTTNVPQKGSSEKVDTLGDRLMTWLQYRNKGGTQSLWVSRTVKVGTYTGIRWYEIRNMAATPSVYQQGTYAPNSNFRWMPSLAVDKFGNMAIGYSISSSSMYPAIGYAGRLISDPLNTLGRTERVMFAGTGSQSGGYERWGDYSSMSVDPSDDCTFWYTTEYYQTTGYNWQTRIGSFKFPACP